jgi:hypothetical protein
MKTLLSICAALAMTFCAATAFAADVTGAWTAEMKMPDGTNFQLGFNFKQDGNTLTGTVQGPQGDPIAISNGKVDGDKFTFDVSFNGMTIHHDCKVDGDTIKMTTKSDSGDFPGMELTLKRATAATPAPPAAPAPPTGTTATPQ